VSIFKRVVLGALNWRPVHDGVVENAPHWNSWTRSSHVVIYHVALHVRLRFHLDLLRISVSMSRRVVSRTSHMTVAKTSHVAVSKTSQMAVSRTSHMTWSCCLEADQAHDARCIPTYSRFKPTLPTFLSPQPPMKQASTIHANAAQKPAR
jgi:hypothetical protein